MRRNNIKNKIKLKKKLKIEPVVSSPAFLVWGNEKGKTQAQGHI